MRKARTIAQARNEVMSWRPTAGKWPASVQRWERPAVWAASPARAAITGRDDDDRRRMRAWARAWIAPTV